MWLLRIIAFIGDILKRVSKVNPPLTTFRLNNELTGLVYPINNQKNLMDFRIILKKQYSPSQNGCVKKI